MCAKPSASPRSLQSSMAFFGVVVGWGDDVVCDLENGGVGKLYSAALAAGHGMSGDKFGIVTENRLNFIHDTALDAGHVGNDDSAFEKVLIFLYPFHKNVGIKGENHKVGRTDKLPVHM